MADQIPPSDPQALHLLLNSEMTVAQADELTGRLNSDPSARSAVDAELGKDTVMAGLNSTVASEMRNLPGPLVEVMGKLKQSDSNASQLTLQTQGFTGNAVSSTIPFLSAPQAPGELGRLNGYRILRILGQGGMGIVFAAEDIKLKRQVALKVMKPEIAAKEENRVRFLREAQAAAAVEHDHIVPIFQVGEDNGVPFIAMPFLKGEALADRLKRDGRPAPGEVLRIGREIAQGLAAAHRAGLIHRDIKPANIWLEEERDRVKILDFGLARLSGDEAPLTQVGAILGTPAYMSPEQVQGKEIDPRADLFSLGCVLYEMATGKKPFVGPDSLAVLCNLTVQTPPEPKSLDPLIPAALSDLIMRLLAKDPTGRPPSAQVVAEKLARLEAGPDEEGTTLSRRKSLDHPPRAAPHRRPWYRRPVVLTAAVLCLLIGTVGWFYGTSIVRIATNQGELVIEVSDPDVEVVVRQNDVIISRKDGNTWLVSAGKGVVELTDRKTGETLIAREFQMKRNGKEQLRITLRELAEARAEKHPAERRGTEPAERVVFQDPGNLLAFQGQVGMKLAYRVTGSLNGSVWGTNVYSADSPVAVAAVHAGLLKVGETGVVEVETVVPPLTFTGSTRHGITTYPYERYPGAYRFPKAVPGPAIETAPVVATNPGLPSAEIGKKYTLLVTGNRLGSVWGTYLYTQDSDPGAAAVHAGLLAVGESRQLEMEFVSAPSYFTGSTRYGVVSQPWTTLWQGGTYRFPAVTPFHLSHLRPQVGARHSLPVLGNRTGYVWGTDVYTHDSDLGTAAVHAGIVKDGEIGLVEIEFIAPPATFDGTLRHGVTTYAFGSWRGGAFRIVRALHGPVLDADLPVPSTVQLANLMTDAFPIGKKTSIRVAGNASAFIFGTDVYTADSDVGTAAVHAGLLRVGESGLVEVEIIASPVSFVGTTRHGIVTSSWALPFPKAFRFVNARQAALHDPALLATLKADVGMTYTFQVTGKRTGVVYGTYIYTQDSDLGAAAVQAGLLQPGEIGKVEIEFVARPQRYFGFTRNGITSLKWDSSFDGGAFRFLNVPRFNLADYFGQIGKKISVPVKGAVSDLLYGTDVYTLDSDLGAAAVHAGLLRPGETKTLEIEILAAPKELKGTTRNGVTSTAWGEFPEGVFRFIPADGK